MTQSNKIKVRIFYITTLAVVALIGIDLEYIQRQLIIPKGMNNISKVLSLIFILALPFVLNKIFTMLNSSRMIIFFVTWVIVITAISFVVTKILGYQPRFSNEFRTLVQVGGFVIGIVLGYYICKLMEEDPLRLTKVIHFSMLLVFIGIFFQFFGKFFFETSARYQGRLFGLSGEPKFLGMYLVPYMIALVVSTNRYSLGKILVLTSCLIALTFTTSSTAFISLIFMIGLYAKIYGLTKVVTIKYFLLILLLTFIIILMPDYYDYKKIIFGRIYDYFFGMYDIDMQEQFTFPIIGTVTVEANEFPVLLYFRDNPFFIFTGIGLGQESIFSFRYIDETIGGSGFLKPGRVGYITPNSSLIQSIANYGLIMVTALTIWSIKLATKINKYLKGNKKFIFYFFFSHFILHLLIFKTKIPITTSMVVLLSFAISFYRENYSINKK